MSCVAVVTCVVPACLLGSIRVGYMKTLVLGVVMEASDVPAAMDANDHIHHPNSSGEIGEIDGNNRLLNRTEAGSSGSTLQHEHRQEKAHQARLQPRQLERKPKLLRICLDVLLAAVAVGFVVFACLVFKNRGRPVDEAVSSGLLEAGRYGATIFAILFAAITGRFLRSIAALKLEHGTTVLSVEYLLGCRTVFSTFTKPLELRALHWLVPCLLVSWALSPVGSQASLRIISTETTQNTTVGNFTYLAFVSDYNPPDLSSTDSLFSRGLSSASKDEHSAQDQYGNVKIPLYQNVQLGPVVANDSSWHPISTHDDEVTWNSLQGLPIYGLPTVGRTEFVLNTAYMGAECQTANETHANGTGVFNLGAYDSTNCSAGDWGTGLEHHHRGVDRNCWNGAHVILEDNNMIPGRIPTFSFSTYHSLEHLPNGTLRGTGLLSLASCRVSMNYVEARVVCDGRECWSDAVRPAEHPRNHTSRLAWADGYNAGYYSPLSGLGQVEPEDGSPPGVASFLIDFVDATRPAEDCSDGSCPPSLIETYFYDPFTEWTSTDSPPLWEIDDELFSTRFTQLLNTFWIDAIAAGPVVGDFNLTTTYEAQGGDGPPTANLTEQSIDGYNLDWTTAEVKAEVEILRCSVAWFVVLLLASIILILASIATIVLDFLRKGPDYLDSFTTLLRWNRYVDVPELSSIEDSVDVARRLRGKRVLFGNIRPGDEVGFLALGGKERMGTIEKGRGYT